MIQDPTGNRNESWLKTMQLQQTRLNTIIRMLICNVIWEYMSAVSHKTLIAIVKAIKYSTVQHWGKKAIYLIVDSSNLIGKTGTVSGLIPQAPGWYGICTYLLEINISHIAHHKFSCDRYLCRSFGNQNWHVHLFTSDAHMYKYILLQYKSQRCTYLLNDMCSHTLTAVSRIAVRLSFLHSLEYAFTFE